MEEIRVRRFNENEFYQNNLFIKIIQHVLIYLSRMARNKPSFANTLKLWNWIIHAYNIEIMIAIKMDWQ